MFLCDGHHHPSIPRTFSSSRTENSGSIVFNRQDRRCRRSPPAPGQRALSPGAESGRPVSADVGRGASSWPPHPAFQASQCLPSPAGLGPATSPRPQTPNLHLFKKATVSSPPPASLSSQRGLKIPGVILDENSRISQTSTGPFLSAGDERGPRTKANIPGRGCLSAERRTPCVTSRHCVGSGDEGGLQHSR